MKIYIPEINYTKFNKSELFTGIRPFLKDNKIGNYPEQLEKWGIQNRIITLENKDECDFILYPLVISSNARKNNKFVEFHKFALSNKVKKIVVYISGDYGFVYPKLENVIYYRMGGFNSQLDRNNRIFPFLLSDHLKGIMDLDSIVLGDKKSKPVIGFCGHASFDLLKFIFEKFKFLKMNIRRFSMNNFNFEPLFPSAYKRKKILKLLSKSSLIEDNFIFRDKYRGGFTDESTKIKTTQEYYQNIIESDYILCVRGSGNFSVRFYETLLMGRIPILIDTDCKLPFEDLIKWDNHIIRIPWNKRQNVDAIVKFYHDNLNSEQFKNLQISNRNLWLNFMNLNGFFEELKSLC